MTKFIFLDTNVFIHCKSFTEIEWKDLFDNSQEVEEIIIVVPYIVNKELDNLKNSKKKAREVQSKLKDFKDVEFKEDITLNITIFPIKWESLKSEWREKLDESESDCKIIAEILKFKETHSDDEIYFVTADNTPYHQAKALGIDTIFWSDEKYKSIFVPKAKSKKKNKLTDLKIHFKNRKNKYELPKQNELSLDDFIAEEFPNFQNLLKEEKIDEKMSLREAQKKGITVREAFEQLGDQDIKKFLSVFYKSHDQIKKEVLKYYEEMKEYRKYKEIGLYLSNNGNRPYNNVNIEICTLLEKGFDLKSKEEVKKPEKPNLEGKPFQLGPISSILTYPQREYNVKYRSPEKIKREKNDLWIFGYNIRKIQHNDTLSLYSLSIKFPNEFKTKIIQFSCSFKHDEEGFTKEQKLKLDVSTLIP